MHCHLASLILKPLTFRFSCAHHVNTLDHNSKITWWPQFKNHLMTHGMESNTRLDQQIKTVRNLRRFSTGLQHASMLLNCSFLCYVTLYQASGCASAVVPITWLGSHNGSHNANSPFHIHECHDIPSHFTWCTECIYTGDSGRSHDQSVAASYDGKMMKWARMIALQQEC